VLDEGRRSKEVVTGLLYFNPGAVDLCNRERLPATPLRDLGESDLRLSREQFRSLQEEWS
jgi:hypothetical protein